MTSSAPLVALDSIVVLRLQSDTGCPCGETLAAGERVGFDVVGACVLCLRCTAVATSGDRITAGLLRSLDPEDDRPPVPAPAADLAVLRERCVREVQARRVARADLEQAYRTGVFDLVLGRLSALRHSGERTRATTPRASRMAF